jgi:hypothetical protein
VKRNTDNPDNRYGLLACGSSGRWSVDLDESADGTEWSLQLDGPQVYLTFAVNDPRAVGEALTYLRGRKPRANPLPLGHFESADVSFHWDDEVPPRCFLIVGPAAGSTVRVTLSAEDVGMIADALEQVHDDLPPEAGVKG